MITQVVAPVGRLYRLILVCILLVAAIAGYALPGERRIDSLNFSNADVTMVLKALADLSGANIVIGPAVKGSITVKLTDVTVEDALNIITKELGLAYAVANGAYVVNDPATIAMLSPTTQGYEIVKLKWLQAADVASALAITFGDLKTKELPDHRLVITGDRKRLQQAVDFIQEIDLVPQVGEAPAPGVEMAEVVYKVKSVVPRQAKQYLEDLYETKGLTISYAPKEQWAENVSLLSSKPAPAENRSVTAVITTQTGTPGTSPATPTATPAPPSADAAPAPTVWESQELILRGPKAVVNEALVSIAKVDIEVPMTELRRSVKKVFASQAITYLLQRFRDKGLTIITAPMTYSDVISGAGQTAQDMTRSVGAKAAGTIGTLVQLDKDGKLNISEPIGDFILRGPDNVVKDADLALTAIDVGPERIERIYSLRFLNVADAKKRLDDLYSSEGLQTTIAPGRRGETQAIVTNANAANLAGTGTTDTSAIEVSDLVLRGPEAVVANAEKMLDTLDEEPAQIAVHAEIISVVASELNNLGVQWSGITTNGSTPDSVTANLNEQQSGDPLQLGRILRDPLSLSATLNVMVSSNKAKIINRPTTVTQNGHEAVIHAGEEIYYMTVSGFSSTGTPIYQTQSVNTGVTLRVRPLMSKDGIITMEISTNIADNPQWNTGPDGTLLPEFNETSNTTIVQMRDNETLVVGGLRQMQQLESVQQIPLLGNIPLLGALFRNKQTTPSNTELLILVTPSVLHAAAAPVTGVPTPAVP